MFCTDLQLLTCTEEVTHTVQYTDTSYILMRREARDYEGVTVIELKFGLKQTNPAWKELLRLWQVVWVFKQHITADEESKVNASRSRGFDVASAAWTGKTEIWVCFLIRLHNKRGVF